MSNKLPFGKHRGCLIEQLPVPYLRWLARQDKTDLEYWAELAKAELDKVQESDDLEAMADDLLRQSGIDPDKL
jgi:uncharacterized protein (DUF3820 family)